MTMRLHPDTLVAAYELLKTCPPFRGWKLPDSDSIEFRIVSDQTSFGEYEAIGDRRIISVSASLVGHLSTFISTLSHEVCHLHLDLTANDVSHGPAFQRAWKSVAKNLGFDPLTG